MRHVSRLSLAGLDALRGTVNTPSYDPRGLGTGIVHLGVGAFHRAHQADFTDQAADLVECGWGIVGVTQRSRRVVNQLQPQDGLFTVAERSDSNALQDNVGHARIVGCLRQVLHVGSEPAAVTKALADPGTRIVSITVTEKGYNADLGARRLDLENAAVQADLRSRWPHRTVVGQLVSGFAARAEHGRGGTTVLCCDNVVRGGELVQTLCHDFLDRWDHGAAEETRSWLAAQARFPNTLVDRIVPATTPDALDEHERRLGYRDEALVTAESYGLWVIEDDFVAGRPLWRNEHVKTVSDIGPWSALKLRMLNGAHSTLAYLGLARGLQTVADAVADSELAVVLDDWLGEAARSLDVIPEGIDTRTYANDIIRRFSNGGIRHNLHQIAMDGSAKLPARVLPVAAALTTRGEQAPASARCLAAWLHYIEAIVNTPTALGDPLAKPLCEAAGQPPFTARAMVERVLGPRGVVSAAPILQEAFLDQVADAVGRLRLA